MSDKPIDLLERQFQDLIEGAFTRLFRRSINARVSASRSPAARAKTGRMKAESPGDATPAMFHSATARFRLCRRTRSML